MTPLTGGDYILPRDWGSRRLDLKNTMRAMAGRTTGACLPAIRQLLRVLAGTEVGRDRASFFLSVTTCAQRCHLCRWKLSHKAMFKVVRPRARLLRRPTVAVRAMHVALVMDIVVHGSHRSAKSRFDLDGVTGHARAGRAARGLRLGGGTNTPHQKHRSRTAHHGA